MMVASIKAKMKLIRPLRESACSAPLISRKFSIGTPHGC